MLRGDLRLGHGHASVWILENRPTRSMRHGVQYGPRDPLKHGGHRGNVVQAVPNKENTGQPFHGDGQIEDQCARTKLNGSTGRDPGGGSLF